MIEADTPNLWELRNCIGHPATIAILVKAFIHAAKLVNLDKNLTDEQIGEAANDVLEQFGCMKVEEIKYVLKRALRNESIYARLDYNVLMNWFEKYNAERTEEAIRISDQRENEAVYTLPPPNPEAVSFDSYIDNLQQQAQSGDSKAAEKLRAIAELRSQASRFATPQQRHQDELAYKKYMYDYIKSKKQ